MRFTCTVCKKEIEGFAVEALQSGDSCMECFLAVEAEMNTTGKIGIDVNCNNCGTLINSTLTGIVEDEQGVRYYYCIGACYDNLLDETLGECDKCEVCGKDAYVSAEGIMSLCTTCDASWVYCNVRGCGNPFTHFQQSHMHYAEGVTV